MKQNSKIVIFSIVLLLVFSLAPVAYAHPGRTDSKGGHTDHSTGEYHYHHGYPAHDHYDIDGDCVEDCPYDFDNKTGSNSGTESSRNGNSSVYTSQGSSFESDKSLPPEDRSTQNVVYSTSFGNIIICLLGIVLCKELKQTINTIQIDD